MKQPLISLNDLFRPKSLVLFLNELDSNFESKSNQHFALSPDDDFDSTYNNLLNILYVIDQYLELNTIKENFTSAFNINLIKINDLMKLNNEKEQIKFAEILIVLSFLSPKKDMYLENLGKLNEETINYFVASIEEYFVSTGNEANETFNHLNEDDYESDVSINYKVKKLISSSIHNSQRSLDHILHSDRINTEIMEAKNIVNLLETKLIEEVDEGDLDFDDDDGFDGIKEETEENQSERIKERENGQLSNKLVSAFKTSDKNLTLVNSNVKQLRFGNFHKSKSFDEQRTNKKSKTSKITILGKFDNTPKLKSNKSLNSVVTEQDEENCFGSNVSKNTVGDTNIDDKDNANTNTNDNESTQIRRNNKIPTLKLFQRKFQRSNTTNIQDFIKDHKNRRKQSNSHISVKDPEEKIENYKRKASNAFNNNPNLPLKNDSYKTRFSINTDCLLKLEAFQSKVKTFEARESQVFKPISALKTDYLEQHGLLGFTHEMTNKILKLETIITQLREKLHIHKVHNTKLMMEVKELKDNNTILYNEIQNEKNKDCNIELLEDELSREKESKERIKLENFTLMNQLMYKDELIKQFERKTVTDKEQFDFTILDLQIKLKEFSEFKNEAESARKSKDNEIQAKTEEVNNLINKVHQLNKELDESKKLNATLTKKFESVQNENFKKHETIKELIKESQSTKNLVHKAKQSMINLALSNRALPFPSNDNLDNINEDDESKPSLRQSLREANLENKRYSVKRLPNKQMRSKSAFVRSSKQNIPDVTLQAITEVNSPDKRNSLYNQTSSFSSDNSDNQSNNGYTMRKLNVHESFNITLNNEPIATQNIKLATINSKAHNQMQLRTISTEKFDSQRSNPNLSVEGNKKSVKFDTTPIRSKSNVDAAFYNFNKALSPSNHSKDSNESKFELKLNIYKTDNLLVKAVKDENELGKKKLSELQSVLDKEQRDNLIIKEQNEGFLNEISQLNKDLNEQIEVSIKHQSELRLLIKDKDNLNKENEFLKSRVESLEELEKENKSLLEKLLLEKSEIINNTQKIIKDLNLEMNRRDCAYNAEKEDLISQLSNLREDLLCKDKEINKLKTSLISVKDTSNEVILLNKEVSELKLLIQSKEKEITSLTEIINKQTIKIENHNKEFNNLITQFTNEKQLLREENDYLIFNLSQVANNFNKLQREFCLLSVNNN